MKRLLALFISLAMTLCSFAAFAETGEKVSGSGLTWVEDHYRLDVKPDAGGVCTIPFYGEADNVRVFIDSEEVVDKVVIEDGYTDISIDGKANTLYIPESVKSTTFSEVKDYNVDEANPYLCDIDGVLFTKDKTKLIRYGYLRTDESYAVPDGTVEVFDLSNKSLKEISFPKCVKDISLRCICYTSWYKDGNMHVAGDGILLGPCKDEELVTPIEAKSIAEFAFEGSTFKSIHIGGSVKSVGGYAFDGCTVAGEIIIDEGVEEIGSGAFRNLNKNEGISVWTFDKDGKNIVMESMRPEDKPWVKELVLPQSLKLVEWYAFDGAKIENIYFPEGAVVTNRHFASGSLAKLWVKRGSEIQKALSSYGQLCFDLETKSAILPEYNGDQVKEPGGMYQIGIWGKDEFGITPCDSEHQWTFDGDKKPFVIMNDLYVPLRLTCERFGIPIYWNQELGIAQVGQRGEVEPRPSVTTAKFGDEGLVCYNGMFAAARPSIDMMGEIMGDYKTINEKGSHSAVVIDGSIYVPLLDIADSGLLPGYVKNTTSNPLGVIIVEE